MDAPTPDSTLSPASTAEKKRSFLRFGSPKNATGGNSKQLDDYKETIVNDTKAGDPPVSYFSLFRFATRGEILLNALGLVAAAAAGAAAPLMSIFFGNITQDFVTFSVILADARAGSSDAAAQLPSAAAHFRHTSANNALYLAILGFGIFAATHVYMHTWAVTSEQISKRIRERYLQAVLRQDPTFFDDVGAGEVVTRIQTDTHLIQQGISEKVALCFFFISAFISGFVNAFVHSWRMAIVLATILPALALIGGSVVSFGARYSVRSLHYVSEGATLAEETISTIRTAHAFGTQETLAALYDKFIRRASKADAAAATVHGSGVAAFYGVVFSSYALAFSYGVTLINRNQADVQAVITVFISILNGSISVVLLSPELQALTLGIGAASKVFATIDRVPLIDSASPSGSKPAPIIGALSLENVRFTYPSRPDVPILKDISLTFPAGKTTALVGASGSGKSTIIALVERFYDPAQGVVRLDDVDLRELNVKYLRAQIGLVSQEPVLFNTTVRENVKYGLLNSQYADASEVEKEARIRDACVRANAHAFVEALPQGYDTVVGERGFLLSGGQKQRIAIARATVGDPKILLLDEATSALDTASEGIVQSALDNARAGRTTITIAHRLSTIKDADAIYVMGDGAVLEHGTHSELLSNPRSSYAQLVAGQTLRDGKDRGSAREERQTASDQQSVSTGEGFEKEVVLSSHPEQETPPMGLVTLFIKLIKFNRESWRKYILGFVFAILSGVVFPAYSIVYSKGIVAFSDPDPHARRQLGDRTALYMFVIAIGAVVTILMENYLFGSTAATLMSKLRSQLFRAVLGQQIEFFDHETNSTGSLISNLSDHPQKVKGLMGVTLGVIVEGLTTLVAGWIVGLIFAWKLGLVAIGIIIFLSGGSLLKALAATSPLLFLVGFVRLRVVELKDGRNKLAHATSAQVACEAAASFRTVAALTAEDHCCARYSESLVSPLEDSKRAAVWSALLFAGSQALSYLSIALVFWYGAILVSRQEYTTFEFFVTLQAVTFGSINAGNVFSFAPDLSSARSAGVEMLHLIESKRGTQAISKTRVAKHLEKAEGRLKFENVHFTYPTRPEIKVLRGLSFEAAPGQYIALVGASGSGKSTVIQIIERFYEPVAGRITLDGVLIDALDISDYRTSMALVSQEPTLYAGTVRFNILLGAVKPETEVTQQEIEDVCRAANILEFIQSLPHGFETEVGGKGSQLSGGQKRTFEGYLNTLSLSSPERIAIARALIRDPKVLLLDEATSALDSTSEKVVQQALDNAAAGRTTIAIAHRLSTIQNADRIYFIKEGIISETGTHDELLRRNGDYSSFVRLQGLATTANP